MYVDVTLFVETPFFLSSMQDSSMSLPTKKKINSIFQLKVYLLKTTFQLKVHLLSSLLDTKHKEQIHYRMSHLIHVLLH